MKGSGRAVFAATLLLIIGFINIIYGIGALGDANVFVGDTRFVFTNLHTYGWVLIVLGIIQITGGASLIAGHIYGRVIAIVAGSIGAIEALVGMGGHYPFWSFGVFLLCIWVVWGVIEWDPDEIDPGPRV